MNWFLRFPWLTLALVLLAYSTFGWYIASSAALWSHQLVLMGESWKIFLDEDTVALGLHLFAALTVLLVTCGLIAPVALLTGFFGSSFKSDYRASLSILLWSFAFVVMLRWLSYFLQVLVLISAAILAKLELQELKFTELQVWLLLSAICFSGFGLGILAFHWYTQKSA